MRPRITIRNLQRSVRVNVSALQKWAEKTLRLVREIPRKKATPLDGLEEIWVILISDRRMTALHRQFLHRTGPTDVITFDHGEIFISTEMARRQARQFGNSLERELQLYIAHGLLHLHGFDDQTPRGAQRMKQTQEKILATLN